MLGCGYWGRNLVRNFAALGALEAVHDPDPERAAEEGATYGVPALSLQDVLSSTSIDAVAISAPAAQHADLARQVLRAGKDVFVEKPLALRLEDAEELCHLAEGADRILMVGHLLQYHPAYLELARMVEADELGKLQYLYSNRLNLGRFRREENIWWSFAPHDISMILALAGEEPETVHATGSSYLNEDIADVTTTNLHFGNGINAHIFVSWLHPYKDQKLVVVGERGMAVFDDTQEWADKLVLYRHHVDWDTGVPQPVRSNAESVPLSESEPLEMECRHFLECVAQHVQPRTDGREGLRVLRVLDRAQRSMS